MNELCKYVSTSPSRLFVCIYWVCLSVISLLLEPVLSHCIAFSRCLSGPDIKQTRSFLLLHTHGEAVNWFKSLLLRRVSTVLSRKPKQRQQHVRKNRDELFFNELCGNTLHIKRDTVSWGYIFIILSEYGSHVSSECDSKKALIRDLS